MTTFKVAKKDALSDTRTNIYDLHEKRLEYFESEKKKIGEYRQQLKEILEQPIDIEKRFERNVNIERLQTKINNIENDSEMNEYLLDFIEILPNLDKTSFFEGMSQKGVMDSFINSTINTSKSELYNEYIKKFNPELKSITLPKTEKKECKKCGSTTFIFETKTCNEICTECGFLHYILYNDESNPVYTENIEQVVVFNYKRNNHFQECLNQLQAKENTTIPPVIIQKLAFEFKKYNITNPKMFTPTLVKSYLRKLHYNKYYEHIPTIINEFCGLPAPKLTPELEQQLKIMFDEIQVPFEKYSKIICPSRKNFLNYNYVFYKMCQLLNKDEFLNCFPLLKSREKLYEHDLIWKGICQDLRWEFIPSI